MTAAPKGKEMVPRKKDVAFRPVELSAGTASKRQVLPFSSSATRTVELIENQSFGP